MSDQNPYQSPEALPGSPRSGMELQKFPRFNPVGVFFLQLITLGIYSVYWLYTRSLLINASHENKVPMGMVYALVGIVLLVYLVSSSFEVFSMLFIVFFVLYFNVLFTVRDRMQHIFQENGLHIRVDAFLTLLFNTVYLQYKVNQALVAVKHTAAH